MGYKKFIKAYLDKNRFFIEQSIKNGVEHRDNAIINGEPVLVFVDKEFFEIWSPDKTGDYGHRLHVEKWNC